MIFILLLEDGKEFCEAIPKVSSSSNASANKAVGYRMVFHPVIDS
jgi:hypothetical protein